MPLADKLASLLGPDRVSTTATDIATHATDKWFAANNPDVVVFAHTTDDVSRLLKFCNENKIPVTPRGAGVGYVGGCVPAHGGVALSLAKMDALVEVNPLDGVAVAEPGVITGDLQQAARDKGWFYPPDPASLKECSIGGNIATNAGGPRCLKYGVTRHYVLGLEAVLADGTVLKAGGRTHKNKTGFDLVGNFVGSEGMLGVVTQATLRLIPEPPSRAMLSAGFNTFPAAADAVQKILGAGFLPSALEITDKFTLQAARDYKGAEMVPDGQAHLLIEIDGQKDSVRLESDTLFRLLDSLGALSVEVAASTADCARLWELRREFSYSLRATGLTKLNEDVTVPRSRLVDLVEFAESLQTSSGFPVACFGPRRRRQHPRQHHGLRPRRPRAKSQSRPGPRQTLPPGHRLGRRHHRRARHRHRQTTLVQRRPPYRRPTHPPPS